jgi:hypothetical protein
MRIYKYKITDEDRKNILRLLEDSPLPEAQQYIDLFQEDVFEEDTE